MSPADELGVAIIGAGYWGPNLLRNFKSRDDCSVLWLCELSEERAQRAVERGSPIKVTQDYEQVLNDPAVAAVVLATPPYTHAPMTEMALESGKHVLVEKPLATNRADAESLVALADRQGLVLMCDHTYCFTPAVQKIRDLVYDGTLGEIQYFDSVRINLGLVQSQVDVLWDLAPHDLSILDFILPSEFRATAVAAQTADPLRVGQACVGYLTLPLAGNAIAHVHVNWLSPTKIRKTIIAGTKKMLVWDDLDPQQRLTIFDKGVDMLEPLDDQERRGILVSYRIGDIIAPALPEVEALRQVVAEFLSAIREGRPPLTDGRAGLRVVATLEAATRSAAGTGGLIPLRGMEDGSE